MEIVIASGKGGTGKTFLVSNLSYYLAQERREGVIAVDADVEAPDLLLTLGGGVVKEIWSEDFFGLKLPVIDYNVCQKCWRCIDACEFDALIKTEKGPILIPEKCEGLGTCGIVCPSGAISFKERKIGKLFSAYTRFGVEVITGDLDVGCGNSGRLVYELKRKAYERKREEGKEFLIVDAAPGIGCPVIASLRGADRLVIVLEPTYQSLKGAKRLLEVAYCFGIETLGVLNKIDLNPEFVSIAKRELKIPIIGNIDYDSKVVEAYTSMRPLLEMYPESKISMELREIFEVILK